MVLRSQEIWAQPLARLEEQVPGVVVIRFLVDERGRILYERVLKEKPMGYGFGEKALQAARQYEFTPARLRGIPVKVWMNQEISFELE